MSLKGRTEIEGFSRYEPGKFHKVSIKTSEKLPYRASTAILVMFHHGLSLSLSLSMSMTAPSGLAVTLRANESLVFLCVVAGAERNGAFTRRYKEPAIFLHIHAASELQSVFPSA